MDAGTHGDVAIMEFIHGWALGSLIAQVLRSGSLLQTVTFSIGKLIVVFSTTFYILFGVFYLNKLISISSTVFFIAAGLVFSYMRHWPLRKKDGQQPKSRKLGE